MEYMTSTFSFVFISQNKYKKERVTGIEPAYSAWEADILPLNYTRNTNILVQLDRFHNITYNSNHESTN